MDLFRYLLDLIVVDGLMLVIWSAVRIEAGKKGRIMIEDIHEP